MIRDVKRVIEQFVRMGGVRRNLTVGGKEFQFWVIGPDAPGITRAHRKYIRELFPVESAFVFEHFVSRIQYSPQEYMEAHKKGIRLRSSSFYELWCSVDFSFDLLGGLLKELKYPEGEYDHVRAEECMKIVRKISEIAKIDIRIINPFLYIGFCEKIDKVKSKKIFHM